MSLFVDIEKKLGAFHLRSQFEAPDETMALLGASGCGKSMTLKCIAGIVTPDRGRIVLGDRVLFDSEKKINLPPQQRKVGYLFQQYALFPNMSVEQNILCGIRSGGRTFYRRVGAAFPEGLQDTDKFPTELSCAEASVSAPQSIAANITAATAVVDMIYNILTVGETRVRQITFATGSVNMRPTLQKTRRKAA